MNIAFSSFCYLTFVLSSYFRWNLLSPCFLSCTLKWHEVKSSITNCMSSSKFCTVKYITYFCNFLLAFLIYSCFMLALPMSFVWVPRHWWFTVCANIYFCTGKWAQIARHSRTVTLTSSSLFFTTWESSLALAFLKSCLSSPLSDAYQCCQSPQIIAIKDQPIVEGKCRRWQ